MIRHGLRASLLVLLGVFAVGSGCTCQGQRMRWADPPEAMHAFSSPAELEPAGAAAQQVAWVLEWNGETRTPPTRGRAELVCRFHRLAEKARPKLMDMRFAIPLVFAPDELIATDEPLVVHSDIDLQHFQWALDRRGPLGLWMLHVERSDGAPVYWAHALPCEVRREQP